MILVMYRMDSAPATNRRISRVIEVGREESFRFVGNVQKKYFAGIYHNFD